MFQKPKLGVHVGASRGQSLHATTCLMSFAPDIDNIALKAISSRDNFMKGKTAIKLSKAPSRHGFADTRDKLGD